MKRLAGIALFLLAIAAAPARAWADDPSCESGTAHGSYRHPRTGVIEDAGGEASEALGQSMVESVVAPEAMLETDGEGNRFLSLRFGLMQNISSVDIQVQSPGDPGWTEGAPVRTGQGDDTADFRVRVPGKDAILRAECHVDAMGRNVIFYVTVDGWKEGNSGNFARMGETRDTSALLQGAQGLTTGGGAAPAAGSGGAEEASQAEAAAAVSLDADVWFTLFAVAFLAAFFAGGLLLGLYWMLVHYKRPRKSPGENAAEEEFDPAAGWDGWDDEE